MNEENNESLESFANRVNVHIELNLDTKSKELFDELVENKTITKDLFDLEDFKDQEISDNINNNNNQLQNLQPTYSI